MLRYIGVVQLPPLLAGSENEDLQPGDLDDVCASINGAMQEIWDCSPGESKERHIGSVLHAPTPVTLNVSKFSQTISGITPWEDWMLGCSIRIDGDDQDNEIGSQATLAVPFMGNTATNVHAVIYGDCIQLDPSIEKVIAPVEIPNQFPIYPAKSRQEFYQILGAPIVTDSGFGTFPASPFFAFYRRIIARPRAWYIEGAMSATSVAKRMRIAPMPDGNYPLSYRVTINPPKFTPSDIIGAADFVDPMTQAPIPNDWIESILAPIALQRFTAHPNFKNESAKTEIGRQYSVAKGILSNSRTQISSSEARYV
jgi:hypothetical protein